MHCSSAGEFEQGKPLAEALKRLYPQHKLLITFFSPSGYAAAKKYAVADAVTYLPLDTKKNAGLFLQLVKPRLAIFVKYEFWYHHLAEAASHGIPLLLASAVFRKEQIFFKPYGRFFRQMLVFFRHIFVQDENSFRLLTAAGVRQCSVSGDTRFDRVKEINRSARPVPLIENFLQQKKIVVAGSTWRDDETLLQAYMAANKDIKLILAPHEINKRHLQELGALFPDAVLYSSLQNQKEDVQILIVDTIGLLSRLYQHATLTYVGGGFTKDGIHNVLEAAVWARPVVFGPNYKKYREAAELIEAGGGFSVATSNELAALANDLLRNEQRLAAVSKNAGAYVQSHTGATAKIIRAIQENRLLTRL